jgi:polysaccharide pyruvyl transferase WcaK-like protein
MESSRSTDFVALFGEWNTTNLGDQAIGVQATRYFIGCGLGVKLFALGSMVYLGEITHSDKTGEVFQRLHQAAKTRRTHGGADRKLAPKAKLRCLQKRLLYLDHGLRLVRNWYRLRQMKPQLRQCHIIAVGGGDLLNQQYRNFLTPLYFITDFSKHTSTPLVCMGCSASPSYSGLFRTVVINFVRQAHIVTVRDHATRKSLENLNSGPITIFGDFALDFSVTKRSKKNGRSHTVAINIMMPEKEQREGYKEFLIDLVLHLLAAKAYTITLFTTGNEEDKLFIQRLYEAFPEQVKLFHPDGLRELENFFIDIDLVIASRLHAAILAINHRVPVVAISISSKVNSFFETIGLTNFCYSLTPEDLKELLTFIDFRQHHAFSYDPIIEEIDSERHKVSEALLHLLKKQNQN